MAELTFSVFDPSLGPLVAFSTSEEAFAKKIAVKSQLALSMSKTDVQMQDAVLPFQDMDKIGFIFLFKIPSKDGKAITSSISYVVDQKDQMDIYKKIPVLIRRSKQFAYRLAAVYEYDGKPSLASNLQLFLEKLFEDVKEYRSDLEKHSMKTPMSRADFKWLFSNIKKNLDHAFHSILIDQPVIVFGHRVLVEQVMANLELITPWKIPKKLIEVNEVIDPAGFDLVGVSDQKLAEKYVDLGLTVIFIDKGRVEGGIANKYLQTIIDKEVKPKLSVNQGEKQIKTLITQYHNFIKEIEETAGIPGANPEPLKQKLADSELRGLVLFMSSILFPGYREFVAKL